MLCYLHYSLVFGVDLTTLVMVEGGTIPRIVRQSVAYIEKNCLELEGVYRLSGSTSKVLDLKEKFNDSKERRRGKEGRKMEREGREEDGEGRKGGRWRVKSGEIMTFLL